ncbi:MAG: outer membrane protein assembly factor BamC [Gammaproteobacteria bacterium]|nr:outer membrane protein assembly factor BamC [Gammaproteobacteria bacterium]
MSIKPTVLSRTLTLFLALGVVACGGTEKVQTEDSSADYQAAKSLPPLNKRLNEATPEPSAAPAAVDSANAGLDASAKATAVTAVIEVVKDKARLQVNAKYDGAWQALMQRLGRSDITVHARNKDAGRISIGCGDLATATTVTTSGKWSVFKREPKLQLEYCALQMLPNKRGVAVQVLNRNAEEVEQSAAQAVFQRLLKN